MMGAAGVAAVTAETAAEHGLTPDEWARILELLGRPPSFEELGVFAVMWSEHCSYKSSRALLRQLPTTGPQVLQGPGENAGAVDIGGGLAAVFKIESHNHPSFVEPFQGAATGVGGILRDIFTMGARPVAILDSLRFGRIDHPRTPYLAKGVVAGIGHYGNCVAAHERLLFLNDGEMHDLPIGDFAVRYGAQQSSVTVEPNHPVRVLSVDPGTGRSVWQPVRRIFRRRADRLLKIRTSLGRSLCVTPDHPTVVVRECQLETVPAAALRPGDWLPLSKQLPIDDSPSRSVDLIEEFRNVRPDICVELPRSVEIPERAAARWRALVPEPWRRHTYASTGRMALGVYLAMEEELGFAREELHLYLPGGRSQHVRAVLPLDASLARLIGYVLSEGCVSRNGSTYKMVWTFAHHEEEYVDDVRSLLVRLGLRSTVERRASTLAVSTSSWFFGELLATRWTIGRSADEKVIPEVLMRAPRELRVEVLKGLFRGDASVVSYPRGSRLKVSFATASEILAHQTNLLLQDLGIAASLYERPRSQRTIEGRLLSFKPTYHVEFHSPRAMEILRDWFSSSINQRIEAGLQAYVHPNGTHGHPRYRDHGHFFAVPIRTIEVEHGDHEVFDIEVEDTHLFVCGQGFITHNCIGIPTVGGDAYFDAGYDQNILVNAFTVGIAPRDRLFRARAAGIGNPVIYVGARTGRDGIHGASLLASAAFDETAAEKRPAVQVGDPFTEKLLLEACLTLMQTDHIVAIQDMGAAGLTSSSLEMAGRGGAGILIDLEAVPLREQGMTPYETLLSESQERMLLVARAGTEAAVGDIFARWDLQAVVIGRVTDDGLFRATWQGREVCTLPVGALTESAPVYRRPAEEPAGLEELQRLDATEIAEPADYTQTLLTLLESPNLCAREWIYRQYDQLVGGNTVVRPGGDAAIVRIEGTRRALGLTVDCNSRYCRLDPYLGAVLAVVEAARNLVAAGVRPLAVSDCLNYGNPERPDVMWEFQQGIHGLRDACLSLGTPVVSGNVSFYNETEGTSIPPTPTIAMVGVLDDVENHLTPWWKAEGDVVVLLGRTREELGGSEYLAVIHGLVCGVPPWIDLEAEKRLHRLCLLAAQERLLRSAHDVGEGGLALALAECCFGGAGLGARLTVERGMRTDALLFGESQSRMVVSLRRRHLGQLRELARREEVPFEVLGEVRGRSLVIGELIELPVEAARERWRGALERWLRG